MDHKIDTFAKTQRTKKCCRAWRYCRLRNIFHYSSFADWTNNGQAAKQWS